MGVLQLLCAICGELDEGSQASRLTISCDGAEPLVFAYTGCQTCQAYVEDVAKVPRCELLDATGICGLLRELARVRHGDPDADPMPHMRDWIRKHSGLRSL